MSRFASHESSFEHLIGILRCPSCRAVLKFDGIEQGLPHAREYGVLRCGCSEYPVIDGVSIIMKGSIGAFEHTEGHVDYKGYSIEELTRLIVAKRGLEALLRCITFPLAFKKLKRVVPNRVWQSGPVRGLTLGLRKAQLRRLAQDDPKTHTAQEWFKIFFGDFSPVSGDMYNYFLYRLAQPHHLASLMLTEYLPASDKPVLDLACGSGHLEHNLAESPAAHGVVGVDRNFFQLWAAQYWVAPKNCFLCADVDQPLPFADDSFSATICADAFHYFHHKDFVLREISRCAPGRPVLLTGVGNKLIEPNEGLELTPQEYLDLCGDSTWCLFGETELLKLYLKQRPLDVARPRSLDSVEDDKWLSLVYPGSPSVMTPAADSSRWAHADGRLGINPVYKISRTADRKRWRLQFQFPSHHYAFENVQMVSFCPQHVTLTDETYRQVKANVRSPEVESLIKRMVVIGLPKNYMDVDPS